MVILFIRVTFNSGILNHLPTEPDSLTKLWHGSRVFIAIQWSEKTGITRCDEKLDCDTSASELAKKMADIDLL